MIRVENVRKRFSGAMAVDGVSFSAADGRVTGLLGPNGAGKTTTLRLACGLMKPDAGTITVDGADVAADPRLAQGRLGVLPDASGLYGRLTAREHIRYFGALRGLRGAELERRVEHWIGALGLAPVADRRVAGFSHGERTKVGLARALVHDPRNVLLDEPTNGLDVASTRAVREVVRGLRREGRCVVFSSHVMQEVSALCDRIVVIAAGRVVADGTPEELLAATGMTSLEDAFMALVGLQ
ncbi:MAG TPA: ATP-binding cassette domain-containing protein [Usitatibacter sp.]|nr:ATP-binding cassette domain-containing protein [Usitatibacter sp.]